jgi:hypothetical protein
MLKALAFTAALGAIAALSIADAGALPLAPSKPALENADLSLVRDGCGRGMRYSRRAGGCVPIDGAVVVAPRVVAPMVVAPAIIAPRACPWGYRWSNRFQQCVR